MKTSECTNKESLRKNFHEISGLMLELLLLFFSACAHYPVNQQLESIDTFLQKKKRGLDGSRQSSEELLLILAFSGGGTVLRGLLVRVLLSPVNWFRLMSSEFGKSDLAAEYYDKILFDGATFGDIREQGPLIHIRPHLEPAGWS